MTPPATPVRHGLLDVGDGQRIFWEEWGNPSGTPAVHLHGGPGGSLGSSGYRRRFDLERTRVIGFEQRGCGRSTPHAGDPSTSLDMNDTAHLIADMERLRVHLGVDRWIVNGVSWGSTLALAYALEHPDRVLGMVLMAVTTTGRDEVDWITEGVGAIFPEAWDRLASHAEQSGIGYERGRGRLVEAYARLLESDDADVRDAASREWALWEDTHIAIGTGGVHRDPRWEDDVHRLGFCRLVTHFWSHDAFLDPPILERLDGFPDVPVTLIHGRRDVSGPALTPWRLHRGLPASTLVIEESEGHGGRAMVERCAAANRALVGGRNAYG